MKRFIDADLKSWKESKRRKPLIVRGARQVGKTYSIKEFGRSQFDSLVTVDFERNPDLHRIFGGSLQAKRIVADLEIVTGRRIQPGKTLLYFDEIQACPSAITALRYLYEELPELHVIAAGSLLEFALKQVSFPVGRAQFIHMAPLCFAEYLQAIGHEEAAAFVLSAPKALTPTVHEFLLEQLRRYFFVGGMPESVTAYIDSGSMRESFEVQSEIGTAYRMDFAKYRPHADHLCLNSVLTAAARNVGQRIKYARLGEGYSDPTLKKAFELLCLAEVIRKVPSTDPSGLPLGAGASAKIFKALMVDLGLMRFLNGMPGDIEYAKADLIGIFRGAMAEQFVGQEMVLSQKGDVYYWARQAKSSLAEVDYLAVTEGKIHPVEVKSGAAGRLKSVQIFLQTYTQCRPGIVFSSRPYEEPPGGNLIFVPLYFALSATGGWAGTPTREAQGEPAE